MEYVRRVVEDKSKVFLVMRDPVSRSWSGVKMQYRYKGIDIIKQSVSSLIAEMQYPYTVLRSNYTRIIKTWKTYFDKPTFETFYYDDLVKDKTDFLRKVCDYIGVSSDVSSLPAMNRISNVDAQDISMPMEIKVEMTHFFLSELETLSALVGKCANDWLGKAKEIVG